MLKKRIWSWKRDCCRICNDVKVASGEEIMNNLVGKTLSNMTQSLVGVIFLLLQVKEGERGGDLCCGAQSSGFGPAKIDLEQVNVHSK